ncbi:MAG TPA: N-acetylmuramic acid 6-phosphate etherase [Bacilli bacterium]|nr:N-acetylmuramic acid 6-phosphate etherase [Bacilli bacterium]
MSVDLKKIGTEQRNTNTMDIDSLTTYEILEKINQEDQLVAGAVQKALPQIAPLVDRIVENFKKGGRLIYLGAGTSGRIGIIDAVECRPTFGVSEQMVMCLMAGGEKAFVRSVEGAEDSGELAVADLKNAHLNALDVVVGIAASGRTPYVLGGIHYAHEIGCITGGITTSPHSPLAALVDYPIEAITGPEALTGSTRMKSGTAQKMICNMLSTASMIKMGKVYENLMVDVLATNEKLVSRAHNIIQSATDCSLADAQAAFLKYGSAKKAIFALLSGVEEQAEVNSWLQLGQDNIREALRLFKHA